MDDWFWEGNVVSQIVIFLQATGWTIEQVADTKKFEAGDDIRASRKGETLIIEVKGYPAAVYLQGKKKGQPKPNATRKAQISRWFGALLLTAILRQSDNPKAVVGLALPNFPEYKLLIERTAVSLQKLNLLIYIVHENGQVEVKYDHSSSHH
ncbi:MAG: hypothetical protein DWQ04_08745 [Chloroflexi bacterium]|nr:MAG: hypothetical protein DWQ04_08745 [Chloroflexota bacterium]